MIVFKVSIAVSFFISCGDKSTSPTNGAFDIFGRIVWRPPLIGLTRAEFYIFGNGQPITDAVISVKGNHVPHDTVDISHYSLDLAARIGDTLAYSITSASGTAQGTVIIPDTVNIIRPRQLDTLYTGIPFTAFWHRGVVIEGYYAHLTGQNGLVGQVTVSQIDTTVQFPGENIFNFGADTFWVETLNGLFDQAIAPNGRELPKGVVGAAGNYHLVYVNLNTGIEKHNHQ